MTKSKGIHNSNLLSLHHMKLLSHSQSLRGETGLSLLRFLKNDTSVEKKVNNERLIKPFQQ